MALPPQLLLPAAIVAGALGRRLAGGLLTIWTGGRTGTTANRVAWAAIAGASVWLGGAGWPVAMGYGAAVFAGSTIGYGPPWRGNDETTMRMGRGPGGVGFSWRQFGVDFGWMTYHGVFSVALAVLGAAVLRLPWWPLLAAGILAAPVYSLAWVIPWDLPWLGCYADKDAFDPLPTGELLWGGVLGAASVLTVIM
jgi:hypothetical protein